MLVVLENAVNRLPSLDAPGTTEVTWDEMTKSARSDSGWMVRLHNAEREATQAVREMKDTLEEGLKMISSEQVKDDCRARFDQALDAMMVFDYTRNNRTQDLDLTLQQEMGVNPETMEEVIGGPSPSWSDAEKYKVLTNVTRQYAAIIWRESLMRGIGDNLFESSRRYALRYASDPTKERIMARYDSMGTQSHQVAGILKERISSTLSQLRSHAENAGVPSQIIEEDPRSFIDLLTYAPSEEAWHSGISQLKDGSRTSSIDVIKGWPRGKEYFEYRGIDPSKKKRPRSGSRKPKKAKSKKSAQITALPAIAETAEGESSTAIDTTEVEESLPSWVKERKDPVISWNMYDTECDLALRVDALDLADVDNLDTTGQMLSKVETPYEGYIPHTQWSQLDRLWKRAKLTRLLNSDN